MTIAFTSLLWIWSGEGGRWYFVTVPDEQSENIKAHALRHPRGFGAVRVAAAIGDVHWETSVFPLDRGGYLLPLKAKVRQKASVAVGDEISVSLTLI